MIDESGSAARPRRRGTLAKEATMRLRRRTRPERPEPPPSGDPDPRCRPVADIAWAIREAADALPPGDRDRIWDRVVAQVERTIQRESVPEDDAP